MRTLCVPSKTLWPTLKGCKLGYLVFHRKRLEPRVLPWLPWQQHSVCHSVSMVMYIAGAKFEEQCFNIPRVILDWMLSCFSGTTYSYDVITFLICIIQKRGISPKQKKDMPKWKRLFFFTLKSMNMLLPRTNLLFFFLSRISCKLFLIIPVRLPQ